MKKQKSICLVLSLMLVLVTCFSPLNIFAEELDTPVHEDPIDEIETWSGTESRTGLHFSYYVSSTGNYSTLICSSSAIITCSWREPVEGTGNISYASISVSNVKIDNVSKVALAQGGTIYQNGKARQKFLVSGTTLYFWIELSCNHYGEIQFVAYKA